MIPSPPTRLFIVKGTGMPITSHKYRKITTLELHNMKTPFHYHLTVYFVIKKILKGNIKSL
jgi:hypothetical protein